MSWRSNSQRTGANEAPLANQRRWGGGGGGGGQPQSGYDSYNSGPPGGGGYGQQPPPPPGYGGGYGSSMQQQQQHHQPPPPPMMSSSMAPPLPPLSSGTTAPDGTRKRKSRWGDEKDKIQVEGMPTAFQGGVNAKDLELYATQVRLEEISRKLKSGDVVPPERERSPSPPPTYDHHGRRTNTREIRYRRKLEDERNRLVDKAMRADPNYKPPQEYLQSKRMSGRPSEKIYIPVKEFPEIKWIGLILGPRGNSLKNMERETGAKIVIRGKGSTKEGKGSMGNRSADEDDELHCNVTADTQDKVDACVKLINKVIATAASTPDEQNDHKRNQLRELAMLNGTLRDDENQPCQNCGKLGHRKYDCPEERNFTANIVCRNCGNMGHMARDCIAHRNRGGPGGPGGPQTTPQFDSEYSALMAELGEGPPLGGGSTPAGNGTPGGPQNGINGGAVAPGGQPLSAVPPWRVPSNWHPPQPPNMGPRRDFHHHGPPRHHHNGFQQGPPGGGYGGGPPGGYNQYNDQGYGPPQQQGGYNAVPPPPSGAGQQPPPPPPMGQHSPPPPPQQSPYDYNAYYGGGQQQQQQQQQQQPAYGAPAYGGY